MTKPELLIYLAGLTDGEGTFLLNKYIYKEETRNPRYTALLRINMCDKAPLSLIQESFGGSLNLNKVHWKNENWRDTYMWTISGKSFFDLIPRLLPYLIIKGNQAKLLLQVPEIKKQKVHKYRQHYLTDKAVKELEEIKQKITEMKKVSIN